MENLEKVNRQRRHTFYLIIASLILILGALTGIFYGYSKYKLYEESINQLDEISNQLFERLDGQLDFQKDYLRKLKEELENEDSYTTNEIQDIFTHLEDELAPSSRKIYYRVLDEDGFYYTNEGKQGTWFGNNKLNDNEFQSFLITNWLESENYMAFVLKADKEIKVNNKKITHYVLLRTMNDMKEFFHSSSFKNNNISYVIENNGNILHKNGELNNFDYNGTNIITFLKKQEFPHTSINDFLNEASIGNTTCTDFKIDKNQFYVIYNELPQYDWGLMIVVDAKDVATNTTEMIKSIVRLFGLFAIVIICFVVIGFMFLAKIQKSRVLIDVQQKNNEKLEEINNELKDANEKKEVALKTAKQATKAKSQFLANMSHDIRTPMNAIVGMTKLMENEVNNPEKIYYYVKKLQHSSQYMLGLINDILNMSKIEAGEFEITYKPIKLAEQVGQVESIIRSQCNEKNQELTLKVHGITHEYLIGDSIRLRQVFINLLSNAVKYTPVGGKIGFEIKEIPNENNEYASFIISVIDNGIGISKEFQKKMFEPFAREQNSTTNKVSGTGLGLSIAKNIIDLMGGKIKVKSEVNVGTRFDINLDLPIDKEAPKVTSCKKVLLITKDNELSLNIKAALSNEPIIFKTSRSLDNAIFMLKDNNFDTILISGYLDKDILSLIVKKLKDKAKDAKFIFCCEYANKEQIREMLLSSGIDGFIARPFFVENLLLAIKHVQSENKKADDKVRSPLNGKRFLCAEDNELNIEILQALLSLHGASSVVYQNGKELVDAFKDVKEGDFDAILMDMQMPIMNGLEATKEIRNSSNPLGKKIPIIAMTANAFNTDVEKCLKAGMNAHLAKPLDISELERLLNELLSK